MKLNIGGTEAKAGWAILNVQPAPEVDIVGNVTDLSSWTEDDREPISQIYASHVLEHLSYAEMQEVMVELYRLLCPGGLLQVAVPDLDALCRLFSSPHVSPQEQFHLARIIMGGQIDAYDFHRSAYTAEILASFAMDAGFIRPRRVADFGLFDDCSTLIVYGAPISLNMEFTKAL